MEYQEQSDLFKITLDDETKDYLRTATVWAKIIAIIAFIEAGVNLVTVFIGNKGVAEMVGGFMATLVGSAISVVINLFLYRFATKTASALNAENQQEFSMGIDNLRNYFKILGILIIIALALVALMMVFFLIGVGMR